MQLPGTNEARADLKELLRTIDALELVDHAGHPNAVALGEAVYMISSKATQNAIDEHLSGCPSCKGAIAELVGLVTTVLSKFLSVRAELGIRVPLAQVYTSSLN